MAAPPRQSGLWVEVGSNTYQKYSWPALFNLHELAPDPVIRKRFGLLLDLAFIEEEQISVRGRRGGGKKPGLPRRQCLRVLQEPALRSEGQPAGSSHSRVIETSRYQLPPEAILLRKRAFPAAEPFVIRNRVLGELETAKSEDEVGQRLAADSALVNYAYRTPHYLLGSTLQNPALTMPDPKTGAPTLKYAGISRQNRACGMLFDDPASNEICAVYPVIGHGGGGRPQHSFWSVQHENVLILQRIAPLGRSTLGSYHTDAISIGFAGKALKKVEEGGWIFASNGKAFVGVKFLDGGYQWDEKREVATPANFKQATDKSRILLHAGDIASHGSFDKFKADVLASRLNVTPDKVDYQFGPAANHLEVTLYDAKALDRFSLPLINGKPVDLRPAKTYQSPYLNGDFGSDKISVTVGPIGGVWTFRSRVMNRQRNPHNQPAENENENNHPIAKGLAGSCGTVAWTNLAARLLATAGSACVQATSMRSKIALLTICGWLLAGALPCTGACSTSAITERWADDKTDNTAAFSACLDAVIAAGGGRMYLPDGVYRGRITIPPVSKPIPSWITVEIVGESEPTPVFGTIGSFPLQNHGTIVKCLAESGAAVISADRRPSRSTADSRRSTWSSATWMSGPMTTPASVASTCNYALQCRMENVFVNTGVYNVQASKPTHGTSGLITPANNNAA